MFPSKRQHQETQQEEKRQKKEAVRQKVEMGLMMQEDWRSQCGKRTRKGELCTNPKPCPFHATETCQSTLDRDPNQKCRMPCSAGKFCEYHVHFPDLGLRAAEYYQKCRSENIEITEQGLMMFAYPEAKRTPGIYNLELFCVSVLKRMS